MKEKTSKFGGKRGSSYAVCEKRGTVRFISTVMEMLTGRWGGTQGEWWTGSRRSVVSHGVYLQA